MLVSFVAVVRSQVSPFGALGKITSKSLAEFVGKKVKITVEVVK